MSTSQRELLSELSSTQCRCGRRKKKMMTFCGRCYYALSPARRRALYLRMGGGYEEAYEAAVGDLEARGEDQ